LDFHPKYLTEKQNKIIITTNLSYNGYILNDIHKDDKYLTNGIGNTLWVATAQVDPSVMQENIAIVVGLHMTLECRDTELWPFFGCASQCLFLPLR
jgi:hypothetical protein